MAYPDNIVSLINPSSGDKTSSPSHAAQHSNANNEIESIETELGVNPAGASATVAARLDANDIAVGLNTTHRTSNGSDHSYINQSVVSGAAPTFTGTNFTGIPSAGILTSTVNPTNLLSNGDFESWSAGASAAPDGFSVGGADIAVAQESTIVKLGTYSLKVTRNGADCYCGKEVHAERGIAYWKGRTVTLGCWVYATVANRALMYIYDGVGTSTSSFHTGDSTWQWLTVTRTINSTATKIRVQLQINSGDTSAYFDGAMLVEGSSAFAFSPKPAEEGLWADYSAVSTVVGWSGFTEKKIYYKKIGKTVFCAFAFTGTSNSTAATFTLPDTSSNTIRHISIASIRDNGVDLANGGMLFIPPNNATVSIYADMKATGTPWTASGQKIIWGQIFYERG